MHELVTQSAEDAMRDLLDRHRSADAVRFDVRNNHAPMVLIAMQRMGASADDLHRYYDGLAIPAVESASAAPDIDGETWRDQLGEFAAWPAYCRYFCAEVERVGCERALRTYIGPLMPGVAAHAFHPLLRTAYGVDLDDPEEVAFGLAYWAATYLPAPDPPPGLEPVEPGALLELLAQTQRLRDVRPDSSSITGRIQTIFEQPDFQTRLHPLRLEAGRPLDMLAQTLADAFVDLHHFTILHGVTSCHAMRRILPYCVDPHRAVTDYWHAIAAAHLTIIHVAEPNPTPMPDGDVPWNQIYERAIKTKNEHTIKFVYTCHQETTAYGRNSYRRLAVRETQTAAPFR